MLLLTMHNGFISKIKTGRIYSPALRGEKKDHETRWDLIVVFI